jgi:N-acetylmuramoyl-L-alanine amidase
MRLIDLRLDTCPSTFVLDGLNQQILNEFNKVDLQKAGFTKDEKIDDILVKIDDLPNVSFGSAAYPYVGGQTAKARIRDAVNSHGKTLVINSALRTLAQQFLLWRMFNFGPPTRCGISAD